MSASFWIHERIDYLKANYGTMTAAEIGAELGASARGVYQQARKLGLIKQQHKLKKK